MTAMEKAWFHVIITTYGAWLPGDERGFRTRKHREHIEGDYKSPPPEGKYEALHQSAAHSMRQPKVVIPGALAPLVGTALRDKFVLLACNVLCVAVASQHAHLLVKLPVNQPRRIIGIAKKHAAFILREQGRDGPLWGRRSKEVRVRSRSHQVYAFNYILAHHEHGAWTWSFREAGESSAR